MYVCPQCFVSTDLSGEFGRRQTCPNCGAALAADVHPPWTDVARVRNLAEAGFLADELIGFGIDARVYQLDEFSAASDRWRSQYLIRVPTELAADAAARIREHAAEDAAETAERAENNSMFLAPAVSIDPQFWRPVALVVLAGVASFAMGQRFSEQNAGRRPPASALEPAIESIGRPLVSEAGPGKPRYRLSFDRPQHQWVIDCDRDGDGNFDSLRAIPASGATW
jgi:hypothetical protein